MDCNVLVLTIYRSLALRPMWKILQVEDGPEKAPEIRMWQRSRILLSPVQLQELQEGTPQVTPAVQKAPVSERGSALTESNTNFIQILYKNFYSQYYYEFQ